MKRIVTLLLALLFIVGCFGVGALAENELPSGTIRWLCNDYGESQAKLVEQYNLYNPNVKVEIEIYPRATLMEVIEVKLGAGDTNYDVIFVDQPLVASYAWKDYMLPLNEYFDKEQLSLFTDADLKAGYVSDNLIALPLMSSSQVLMVNFDLLSEAGITLDNEYLTLEKRFTWEEFMEICKQFMQTMDPSREKGYWAFAWGQQNNVYQLLALGNSLGADAIADDGVTIEGVLNTEPWIKAMQFYQDTFIAENITPIGTTDDEMKELFYAGKVAFYVANSIRAKAANFNIGGLLHPYFADGQVAIPTGSWYLGINKATKNLDCAVDFLSWCVAGEGAEKWMRINNQTPARKDLLENIVNGKYEGFDTWPLSAVRIGVNENLNGNGYPRPVSPGFLEFDTEMTKMFKDLRAGVDVTEALNQTAATLQSAFEQYGE